MVGSHSKYGEGLAVKCTYYNNFALQGLPSLRSLDGQLANAVGNPQFRSGQFWNRSRGHGIELAQGTTNTGRNPVFEDNTNWINYSEGSAAGTVAFGYVAHDLTSKIKTALRLTKTDGGADRWGLYQSNSAWNGAQYAYSVYFKVLSYSSGARLELYHTGADTSSIPLGPGHIGKWTRAVLTSSAADSNLFMWITSADADVIITGFQAEAKSYATPFHTLDTYNKSGDQDARSAQYLKIPTAGNFPGMSGGTILISFRPDWEYSLSNYTHVLDLFNSTSARWRIYYSHGSDKWDFHMADGSNTDILSDAQTFSRGDKILLIITWDGTNGDLWTNGVQSSTGTKTQRNVSIPEFLTPGWDFESGGNSLNSVIDEFAILSEPMTSRMVSHVYNELFSKGLPLIKAGFFK